MANDIVTLKLTTKFGVAVVSFEKIKELSKDRFILYSQDRICIGYNESFGMWRITDIVDLLDVSEQSPGRYCEELHSSVNG